MKRLIAFFVFAFGMIPASSFASEPTVQAGEEFSIVAWNRVTMPDGTHCRIRYDARAEIVRVHRLHLTIRYLEETKYRGECANGALIRVGRTRFANGSESELKAGARVRFTPSERARQVEGKTCALVSGNTLEVLEAEGDRMHVRYHAGAWTNDQECADGAVLDTSSRRLTTAR